MYKSCMSKWENVCHSVGLLRFIIIIIIIVIIINNNNNNNSINIIINSCSWFYLSSLRPIQSNGHATDIYFRSTLFESRSVNGLFSFGFDELPSVLPGTFREVTFGIGYYRLPLWLSVLITCSFIRINIVINTALISRLYSSSLPPERRDRESNTLTMYSGGSKFKSRLLGLLYLLFVWFSSLPPNKFLDSITNNPTAAFFHVPSDSVPFNQLRCTIRKWIILRFCCCTKKGRHHLHWNQLIQNTRERVESRVLFRSLRDFSPPSSLKKVAVLTREADLPARVHNRSQIKLSGFPACTKDLLCPVSIGVDNIKYTVTSNRRQSGG